MSLNKDGVDLICFHGYTERWHFTMHISNVGWNANDFKEGLDNYIERKRVNHVIINGYKNDTIKLKFIISALAGTPVTHLSLARGNWINKAEESLLNGLKHTNLVSLSLPNNCISSHGIKYLSHIIKDTSIINLNLDENEIGNEGMKYLAQGLKNTNVIYLSIDSNKIGIEGVKYLANVLHDTNIIYLSLNYNEIHDDGIIYLANCLKNSNINEINLDQNNLGERGVRTLAGHLRDTCIIRLSLNHNEISDYGIKYLEEMLKDTLIYKLCIPYKQNRELTRSSLEILKKNETLANKVKQTFKKLVAQNSQTYDLEFMIPEDKHKDFWSYGQPDPKSVDMDDYLYIVRTINNNPNIKGYIFDVIHTRGYYCLSGIIEKIRMFLLTLSDKFNKFINDYLPDLVNLLGEYSYINLIIQFEDLKFYDIVKNLLLHRELYYVDNTKEILHPFIYKMLHKYNMILYNEHLDPNKKEEIILYYQNHLEIDGAEEIINLFKSF